MTPQNINVEQKPITIYHYKFNKQERLKICDYLINKVINLNDLGRVFEKMNKTIDGTLGYLLSFQFLKDEAPVMFPLHNRHIVMNKDYHSMF